MKTYHNISEGGRRSPGYRLHWEGESSEATQFATMEDINTEIRKQAKACGLSYVQGCARAYVMTEDEWQAERDLEVES